MVQLTSKLTLMCTEHMCDPQFLSSDSVRTRVTQMGCMRANFRVLHVVLGDILIISNYRNINQHDNHIVRKMLQTILSKDR